jgi:hypothetical protein
VTTLVVEIVLWLVAAAAVGLGTGWLLWGGVAQRPPTGLPSDEELRGMRADLERARERTAELRAEVATLRARLAADAPPAELPPAEPEAKPAPTARRPRRADQRRTTPPGG